jgi:uncharacterized membrane protein
MTRVEAGVTRLAEFIVRHWLMVLNLGCALFIVPIILIPYVASVAGEPITRILYLVYRPTCHQIPSRCIQLFGHPMPVCARCFGTYASFWGVCLLYGAWRAIPWGRKRPLPTIKPIVVIVLSIPLVIDGLTQFVGLRESTNLLRLVTSSLMGGSFAIFALPHLETGFSQASITSSPETHHSTRSPSKRTDADGPISSSNPGRRSP